MKLKTKILLIVGIVMLVTIVISDAAVYKISRDSMYNEVLQSAYIEADDIFSSISEFSSEIFGVLSKPLVKYYLSSNDDDFTVCLVGSEEYYNHTVLSADEFRSGVYKEYGKYSYKEYYTAGNNIMIFKFTKGNIEFYRIINVTGLYDSLESIMILMTVLSAVISLISMTVLFLLIKKTLTPLTKLSESARKIAEGAYGERVSATSDDEVGKLGYDFNTMVEAVERHTRELEEAEHKKTLFMADLTHELKTPLTAISGYAQLLRSVELGEEEKAEALTYIYEESKRMDRLSKKMMRLLELEKTSDIEFFDTDVSDIVSAAAETCRVNSKEKDVELVTDTVSHNVKCDLDLMRELVINLIDNGIKACEAGGKVTVRADGTGITVTDNGCGMNKNELEKITEPFYMADSSRSRKSGGAGLGLALVKQIVQLHGMTVNFDSEPGVGTTVTVLF